METLSRKCRFCEFLIDMQPSQLRCDMGQNTIKTDVWMTYGHTHEEEAATRIAAIVSCMGREAQTVAKQPAFDFDAGEHPQIPLRRDESSCHIITTCFSSRARVRECAQCAAVRTKPKNRRYFSRRPVVVQSSSSRHPVVIQSSLV